MSAEQAYPRLGQAILLVAVLLGVSVIEAIFLLVVGGRSARVSGVEFALTVLTDIIVLCWAWRRTGRPWGAVFRFQPVRLALCLPLLLMAVGFSITASEVDNLLRYCLPIPAVFTDLLREVIRPDALSLVSIGLVAPVFEELLFRGLILQGFLRHYSRPIAILASAALFAVAHLNPVQLIPPFALGVIYAWLRLRTGSLWPCVVAHALNNSLVWMLSALLPVQIPGYTHPADGLAVGVFQPLWFDLVGILTLAAGLTGVAKTYPHQIPQIGDEADAVPESAPSAPPASGAVGSPAATRDGEDSRA